MHVIYNEFNGKSASGSAVFQILASYWEWRASAFKALHVRHPKEIFRLLSYQCWTTATSIIRPVLAFDSNGVMFKLPPRRVLQYILKLKGGWTPKMVPNFVTLGMNFAKGPFLLRPRCPEIPGDTTCTSLWQNLPTRCHKTWGNISLLKLLGNVTFPSKVSADRVYREK